MIRIGLVGAGAMGTGIFRVMSKNEGMKIIGVADRNPDKLKPMYGFVSTSPRDIIDLSPDILIDATSDVKAVTFILHALKRKINVIVMNSEVDQLFGRLLAREAKGRGVIYTSDAGDQYGVLVRMAREIKMMGMEIVMAGNIKGFLCRHANPYSQKAFSSQDEISLVQATQNTDGTKLATEMAITANALNLTLLGKTMQGPVVTHVKNAYCHFNLKKARKKGGVVDYILGAHPKGGVFIIAYSDDAETRFRMKYYKMGIGPYYTFYRPYHLCHLETPISVKSVMEGKPILVQKKRMLEVYAYTKRWLKAGTRLDGVGGYHIRGRLEKPDPDKLPIGLTEGAILTRNKRTNSCIRWGDVEHPEGDIRLPFWEKQKGL